jgi:hypothetical protein
MTKDEVIGRAREWAAVHGHELGRIGHAERFENIQGSPPQSRAGWWMAFFTNGDTLDGGRSLWINDSTGDVEWHSKPQPKRDSWWDRLLYLLGMDRRGHLK